MFQLINPIIWSFVENSGRLSDGLVAMICRSSGLSPPRNPVVTTSPQMASLAIWPLLFLLSLYLPLLSALLAQDIFLLYTVHLGINLTCSFSFILPKGLFLLHWHVCKQFCSTFFLLFWSRHSFRVKGNLGFHCMIFSMSCFVWICFAIRIEWTFSFGIATKDTLQLQDAKVTSMKIRTFIKMLQYEEYPNLNNSVFLFQFTLNPVSNSKSIEKKISVNMLFDFDYLLKQIYFCNCIVSNFSKSIYN